MVKKLSHTEDIVQQSIIEYLKLNKFLFTSTGAGLIRSMITQMRMARLGYRKGSPDLLVFIKGGTLCIECKSPAQMEFSTKTNRFIMKKPKGIQSESQKEFQKEVEKIQGHFYILAYSVEDVMDFIRDNNITPC